MASNGNFSDRTTDSYTTLVRQDNSHAPTSFKVESHTLTTNLLTSITNTTYTPVIDKNSIFVYPIVPSAIVLIIVGFFTYLTVFGNLMVLLSFYLERPLRQASNYLIVSLAFSDLVIGLTSTLVFTISQLVGYWPFGRALCKIWFINDWALFSVTQIGAFLIALDRYKTIQSPISYRLKRTKKKVLITIALLWVISYAGYTLAWLLWTTEPKLKPGEKFQCDVRLNDILANLIHASCVWSPLIVMTVLYIYIYKVASALNKQTPSEKKVSQPRAIVRTSTGQSVIQTPSERNISKNSSKFGTGADDAGEPCRNVAVAGDVWTTQAFKIAPGVTRVAASPRPCKNQHCSTTKRQNCPTRTEEFADDVEGCLGRSGSNDIGFLSHVSATFSCSAAQTDEICEDHGEYDDTDLECLVYGDRSKKTNMNNSGMKHHPASKTKRNSEMKSFGKEAVTIDLQSSVISEIVPRHTEPCRLSPDSLQNLYSPCDSTPSFELNPEKTPEKDQAAIPLAKSRTRRAMRTISFILGAFTISYAPFSVVHLYMLISGDSVSEPVYQVCYWLGYLNSALNPFMYAYVNPLFKKTFRRILFLDWHKN